MTATLSAAAAPARFEELDQGVHALVVTITVQPGKTPEFLPVLRERVQFSRRHEAVVDFRFFATATPDVFMGFESFRGKAAFDAFLALPETQRFSETVRPLIVSLQAQVLQPLP